MDGDGKLPKHDTSIDEQKSLPPLTDHDIDIIQQAYNSTGYTCLRFLMVNQDIRKRLSSSEQKWLYQEFRKQTLSLTRNAVNRSENPLHPDSHAPNKRLMQ